jgi:ergothioneine biosynthesis protein EgtB
VNDPESKDPESKGADYAVRYSSVRRTTESLARRLSPEDQMLQSMPEASPVKWHLAHTTWFFETFLLLPHLKGYRSFNPEFTYLFNSYYNMVGERPERPNRGLMSRPGIDSILRYREHVDRAMLQLSEHNPGPEVLAVIEIGLQHEQQHQELIITDIKHAFWMQPLRPAYSQRPPDDFTAPAGIEWVPFEGGIRHAGYSGDGFAFDNESPRHQVLLQPFHLASRLVTNAEYSGFMEDGGYRRPELWLSDGWEVARSSHWRAPLYWIEDDGWKIFTSSGVGEVDWNEPVCHVSFYEADAYARWAGVRLATEFEWEFAAESVLAAGPQEGKQASISGNFLEDERFHPAPAKQTSGPLQQMFGDCWEWTASPYVAYPGYRPLEGALGEYNGKFMCNQMVLRGGSCITPRSHIRASYRNFFPAQTRWQFSGIRLAR